MTSLITYKEKRANSEVLRHNFTIRPSTGVYESRILSSVYIYYELLIIGSNCRPDVQGTQHETCCMASVHLAIAIRNSRGTPRSSVQNFCNLKALKFKLMLNFKVKLASNLQLSPQISLGTHAAWLPYIARLYELID